MATKPTTLAPNQVWENGHARVRILRVGPVRAYYIHLASRQRLVGEIEVPTDILINWTQDPMTTYLGIWKFPPRGL